MSGEHKYGCRKCRGVVELEVRPGSDRIEVRIKEGKTGYHYGSVGVDCKKCGKPVVMVELTEAR